MLVLLCLPIARLEGQEGAALPGWLAGCWRQAAAGEVVEEVWLPPSGGTMVGLSRTVESDTTRNWEHMLIRHGAAGLVFEASPSGQEPAAFVATQVGDSAVEFENLTHDFPRQIRYERRAGDSLLAVVSGTIRDRVRTIQFHYARAACPGP
jgi:hypothetical protein